MSGSAFTIFSPCMSRIRCGTPCVEGCCGPMCRVTSWVSIMFCFSGIFSRLANLILRYDNRYYLKKLILFLVDPERVVPVLIAAQRVVLTERVSLPVRGEVDPPEVRMPLEDYAEHVVGLPLRPIGARPYGGHGW